MTNTNKEITETNQEMTNVSKDKIVADLQKAKVEGELRSEKIREIVSSAVSEAASEFKEGSVEIRSLVKESVLATINVLKEKGGEIQEELTATIQGAIEGLSRAKRQTIGKNQAEMKQLQGKINSEEEQLQHDIDLALDDVIEVGKDKTEEIKSAVNSAVHNIKDSEEVALMKKRYAQLQAQLAIVKANLAERYGDSYENVKQYLDEANSWYEEAKKNPEKFTSQVEDKRREFETKLGEAGTAVAKKEQKVKQFLRELWKSLNDMFHKENH